jgi:hypothetical protein
LLATRRAFAVGVVSIQREQAAAEHDITASRCHTEVSSRIPKDDLDACHLLARRALDPDPLPLLFRELKIF